MLLHVCCAPCSGGIIDTLLEQNQKCTLYFYNPNIYPESEYEKRLDAVIKYAKKRNVALVEEVRWRSLFETVVIGLENEPERGQRCQLCFYLRLLATAKFASEHNFGSFATTLGISRWKNLVDVNNAGIRAGQEAKVAFFAKNWRENSGQERMRIVLKQEQFYLQKYCGCKYSIK